MSISELNERDALQSLRHARQSAHRGGCRHLALTAISLVIGLDIAEAVEVVDHDPGGLLHPLRRHVTEPVEPLDARAVAEMEIRDGIERAARTGAHVQQVARAEP